MSLLSHDASINTQTAQSVEWWLVGTAGGVSNHATVISSETLRVGRRKDMDVCLDSLLVSGYHAKLFRVKDCLFAMDAGSTNGSFLNGTQFAEAIELNNGDCLEFGDASFRVVRRGTNPCGPQSGAFNAMLKTSSLTNALDSIGRKNLAVLLSEGSLAPCYQAIYQLRTGELFGYEFLARSNYPGIETARQLFNQSAKARQDVQFSVFCRQQAYAHCHLNRSDVPVFVNTHPTESLLDLVLPQMQDLREAYPDQGMVLEIHKAAHTEHALIRKLRLELSMINVRLAFDDFGAGQTRIREMVCASADFIKFDPSFFCDLQQISKAQRSFFASILASIQSEGTIMVAQGIETPEMAEICHDIGFDLVQGFYYSHPTVIQ